MMTVTSTTALQAQNLITNGSFESGASFTVTDPNRPDLDQTAFSNGNVNSWYFGGNISWAGGSSGAYNTPDPTSGIISPSSVSTSHFAIGYVEGMLAQNVTFLSASTSYTLEFSYAGGAIYDTTVPNFITAGTASTPGWDISLTDYTSIVDLGQFRDTSYTVPTSLPLVEDSAWQTGYVTFSLADYGLSAGTYVLMFGSNNEFNKFYNSYAYLDNVSITPVPEPSGAMLLGITGVLGILRRRRP